MNKVFEAIDKWAKSRTQEDLKRYADHLNIKDGWQEIKWYIANIDAENLEPYDVACMLFDNSKCVGLSDQSNQEAFNQLMAMEGLDDSEVVEDTGVDKLIKFLIDALESNW